MIIRKLIERRNEIALQVRELNQNLAHIDATIKLFQANYKVEKIENQRGTCARKMFDILRESKIALTSREIAIKMVGENHPQLDLNAKNIGTALLRYEKKGLIKATKGQRNAKLWELISY